MGDDLFGISGTLQAGHFQIERAVAEGGFAVVYRAKHTAFRAPVALKCLKVPGSVTHDQREHFLEKFRAEAELLFRLSSVSPNVVRPLQVGSLDLPGKFVPFLALEWLDGESLETGRARRQEQKKPAPNLAKVVRLLTPVARALWTAHRLPGPDGPVAVIHCDMKPDNIYIVATTGSDTIKILDFGIARVKSVTSAIAGRTSGKGSDQAFTPGYGAPEQWDPERFGQTGPWTDVFGLAVTLVELLYGQPLIEGALGTMMAITVDMKRRPTPRSLGIRVPEIVEDALARALAVDPKERTQDIFSFWCEIERGIGLPPSLTELELEFEPLLSDAPGTSKDAAIGTFRVIPREDGLPSPDLVPRSRPGGEPRSAGKGLDGRAGPATVEPSFAKPALELPDLPAPSRHSVPLPPMEDWSTRNSASFSIGVEAPEIPLEVVRPMPVRRPMYSSQPLMQVHAQQPTAAPSLAPARTLLELLATPLKLAGAAVLLTLVDQGFARFTGEALSFGPVRPYWVSALLVVIAAVMTFARLLDTQ